MTLALSVIGLVVLGISVPGMFGAVGTAQIAVTLVVPAAVLILFWRAFRARLRKREAELEIVLGLETVTGRAISGFLAGVSHELTPHPEACNLRAEALVVAVDYQEVGANLKVAVPDIVVETDPLLLRQILHVLVGNALRHGGRRVAIWAVAESESLRLTVSDDGPGLPPEIGEHVFEPYLDIAEEARAGRKPGSGLTVARVLGELIEGELAHTRDSSWTHFSVRMPLVATGASPLPDRVPLQAGAR